MDKDLKAAIDALMAELATNDKALDAVSDVAIDTGAAPQIAKALELTAAQADKAGDAYKDMMADIDKLTGEMEAAMAAALAACKAGADKATKAYMDAVKDTDGLTAAKPSIVKVLQATGKSPDPAAIKTAVTELGKHKDEMAKKYGKDKDKAKMLASFNKDLDTAAKALGGLI
jgi:hypothetical protein